MSSYSGAAGSSQHPATLILCHEQDLLDFDVDVHTATPSAINQAYRKTTLQVHPDKGGTADEFRLLKNKCAELLRCFQVFQTYKRKHPDILFADCVERKSSSHWRSHPSGSAPTSSPPETAPPWHVSTILQDTLPTIAEALSWLPDDFLEVSKTTLVQTLRLLQPGKVYTAKLRGVVQPASHPTFHGTGWAGFKAIILERKLKPSYGAWPYESTKNMGSRYLLYTLRQ